ncbi:MAG: hypothetical protein IPG50_36755 [Myxococcales bacterium]|nr:hypothetical protein [Myxococcales bacterium]
MRGIEALATFAALTGALAACAAIAGIDRFESFTPDDAGLSTDGAAVDAACVGDACPTPSCVGPDCPELVVTGLVQPRALALVEPLLVWTELGVADAGADAEAGSDAGPDAGRGRTLRAVAKTGGVPSTLAEALTLPALRQSRGDGGVTLAFDTRAAASSLPVSEVKADGGLATVSTTNDLTAAAASPSWFAVATTSSVQVAPRATGTLGPVAEPTTASAMAVSGTTLFASSVGATQVFIYDLSVVDDGAGTLTSTATAVGKATILPLQEFYLDGDRLYVANQAGSVESVLFDAGKGPTIPSVGGSSAVAMTADATHLYVATATGIYAVEKATGVAVLRHARRAFGIAVDATQMYWTEEGAIFRSRK